MILRVLRNRVARPLAAARIRIATKLAGGSEFEYWGRLSDRRNDAPVGDKWLARGAAQFAFLKQIGLKPHHRFLDYGCAVLATAAHVIPYLDRENYVGIDVARASVANGAARLSAMGIERRRFHILNATSPALPELNGFRFDFIFAASVFQYLSKRDFETVLTRLRSLLDRGGVFAVTYSVPEQLPELRKKGMQFYGAKDYERFLGVAELHHPQPWGSRVAVFRLGVHDAVKRHIARSDVPALE